MSFQNTVQSHALISTYGIYKDDVYKQLTKKYPRPSSLKWMRAMGRVNKRARVAEQMTYDFYEEGNYFNSSATIQANVANGTTASYVDITLAAADHTQSGTASFPIVGDQVVFKNETVGYVFSIDRTTDSAHVVTVAPMNATQDVNAAAVNTEKISFFSSADGEDSDAPESRVPDVTKFTNGMQVIRETYRVTDIESKANLWFDAGEGQRKLWVKGLDESVQRFEIKEELALLVGKLSDGTAVSADTGNQIFSTQGLIPTLRANGTKVQYADPIDLDKWDEIVTTIDQNYGDREYLFGMGLPVYQLLQAFMNGFADGGSAGISYDAVGGKEQAISLNLKSFHYVGYDFFFQKWDILSHRDSLGADGLPFKNLAAGMPLGSVKNPVQSDTTAEYEPAVQCVYFESPLSSATKRMGGEYSVWETGAGAEPAPTNAKARREIHHYMIKGLEVRNQDKFLLLHL